MAPMRPCGWRVSPHDGRRMPTASEKREHLESFIHAKQPESRLEDAKAARKTPGTTARAAS
jgi:hypothetical protein